MLLLKQGETSPHTPVYTGILTYTHLCDSLSANLDGKEAGKNGTSLLREVQEEGGHPESKADHHEEQAPRDQRHVPEMQDHGIPHRQSLGLSAHSGAT